MLTIPEKIMWGFVLAAVAYSVMSMAKAAEAKCEVVQTVEAWDEELKRYIPVTFNDCGSFSYTEPENVEYIVVDGKIIWLIKGK